MCKYVLNILVCIKHETIVFHLRLDFSFSYILIFVQMCVTLSIVWNSKQVVVM